MHIFNEEVEYALTRSKAYIKRREKSRKHKGVFRIVTIDEVLKKLEAVGVTTSKDTIQRYVRQGLIPIPDRKSAGRGVGRKSDYDDETPAEFYASHKLRHEYGLKVDFVSRCRKKALLMESNDGLAYIDWIMGHDGTPVQEAGFGQTWLKEKHRVLHEGQHQACPVCLNLKL